MEGKMISIDELVRRRLEGAEEQERPGSWGRMKDLLEEDKKRKPIGFFIWRRAITIVGVMVALAIGGAGGYEAVTAFRGAPNPGNDAAPVSGGTELASANNHTEATIAESANRSSSDAVGAISTLAKSVAGNTTSTKTGVVKADPAQKSSAATSTTNSVAAEKVVKPSSFANRGHHHLGVAPASTGNSQAANANSTLTTTNAQSVVASSEKNTTASADHSIAKTAANMDGKATAANHKQRHTSAAAPAVSKANIGSQTTAAASHKKHPSASAKPTTKGAAAQVGLAVNTKTIINPANEEGEEIENTTIAKHNATAKKNTGRIIKDTHIQKPVLASSLKPAAAIKTSTVAVKSTALAANSKSPAVTKGDHNVITNPATGNEMQDPTVLVDTKTGKRYKQVNVTSLNVKQTLVGNNPEKKQVHYDTLGTGTVSELKRLPDAKTVDDVPEQELASNSAVDNTPKAAGSVKKNGSKKTASSSTGTVSGPVLAKVPAKVGGNAKTGGNTASTSASGQTATSSQPTASVSTAAAPATSAATTAAQTATPVLASAATTANAAGSGSSTDAKAGLTKKKSGASMIEKLSAKFNDIRYNLSGAQFSPGLAVGVNSTFFGNNSFKGFQFGVTGAFEIDDKWTIFTELKYFHRANNNFTMYDNYNKYTAVAGGYEKDSTTHSFSFSTLHSFELPVSIKYTFKKFAFMIGGNILYTLGVNTGASESDATPNNHPIVATNTLVSAPKLNESDFVGRFGMGYLMGVAYQVSPNVTLDVRSVQTFWDNSKSSGMKSVSNELYKSPSMQFTLFYRFGAKKNNQ